MASDPRSQTLLAALEHVPTGIAVLSPHGEVEWVNRAAGPDAAAGPRRAGRHRPRRLPAPGGLRAGRARRRGPRARALPRLRPQALRPARRIHRVGRADAEHLHHRRLGRPPSRGQHRRADRAGAGRRAARPRGRRTRRRHRVDRPARSDLRRQPRRGADPRAAGDSAGRDRSGGRAVGCSRRGRQPDAPGEPARAHGTRHRRARLRHDRAAPRRRRTLGRGRRASVGALARPTLGRRDLQGRLRASADRGRAQAGRSDRPGQERVPLPHEPRAAHPDELGARLRPAAPHRRPRAEPPGGGGPDPEGGPPPARPARRGPRPRAHPERPSRGEPGPDGGRGHAPGSGRARAAPRRREWDRHRPAPRPRRQHARPRRRAAGPPGAHQPADERREVQPPARVA